MILTVLHTNDLHGRFEQLTRLATLISMERALAQKEKRQVLLLDAGDSSERAVWQSNITKGRANFFMLEAMGYDASALGNSETFQWGLMALAKLIESVHFPILAANLFTLESSQPAVAPLQAYTVFNFDQVKVAVVGITVDDLSAYRRFGYRCDYAESVLRDLIPRVRAEADAVILLSHLGFGYATDAEYDAWRAGNPARTNMLGDRQIARAIKGIDLIVGGHSHTVLERPARVNDTVIVQAGEFGKFLGRVDLEIEPKQARVIYQQLIPCTESVPPDPTISGMMELVHFEATSLLNVKVGSTTDDLDSGAPLLPDRESELANVLADIFRESCEADLCIFLSGFVTRGLARGAITRGDLIEAIPGSAHVTVGQVTGAQILKMLDRALAREQVMTPTGVLRGRALGLPAVSANVSLTYDLDTPDGTRVVNCSVNGAAIDPRHTYRLASTYWTLNDTNDVEGYIALQDGQTVEMYRAEQVLWEIMEDWLKDRSPLQSPTMGRVKSV